MPEYIPVALQVISAVIAPILTAVIAWITSSLKKTSQRIDELEKHFNETRIQDTKELNDLAISISAIEATQKTMNISLNRIENYLMSHDK